MSESTFLSYLKESKKRILADDAVVVMGNQACDLDSVVSAVTLGYYEYAVNHVNAVGVIPIKRNELDFRTEITYLLKLLSVSADVFVYLEDLNLEKLQKSKVILVDHNLPTGPFAKLNTAVVEIVDHHDDLKGDLPNLKNKQIEVVGSCTTLVAEKFINNAVHLLEKDSILRQFLLNTILLDTINLEPSMGKVKPKDDWAARIIGKMDSINDNTQLKAIYDAIHKAKNDCTSLTTPQLLIKDYKEWDVSGIKYGFASVLLSIKDLVHRNDFGSSLKQFSEENHLDVLIVMSAFTNPEKKFCRELLLRVKERADLAQKLTLGLTTQESNDLLGLTKHDLLPITDNILTFFYEQSHIQSSRKQVQPLVHTILQDGSSKI
jgi:exopolyphosphatase